jgi:hypothetical protein
VKDKQYSQLVLPDLQHKREHNMASAFRPQGVRAAMATGNIQECPLRRTLNRLKLELQPWTGKPVDFSKKADNACL